MKKLAPPGRKGSVKVGAFKGENLAEEINDQDMARRNEEQQKKQLEADTEAANQEATRLADEKGQALEKQKQAEAETQRKAEKQKEAAAAAQHVAEQQRLEDERKAQEKADRLAQEKKAQRLLELEQEKQRQAEAEQAALEAAAREDQRLQAEAAAQQEQKTQRRLALEQEKQRQAEAEHEAAALEEQRLQAEAAAQQEQKAQRRLALEQEKQRQAEAEHEAAALEEQRLQAEAAAQQEQKAQRRLALEQERHRQAEEQQRLEEEAAAEKVRAREQRRQELEEQRRLAEEAENERVQREQQQEEEELLKLRDAEIARRRALKEQREREAEEERIREQELIDKENQELEAERLRLAEQARLAAEQATETETAEAAAKRKRLEEQRKKRAMFLNDMDSFSNDFEAKTQLAEEQRRETTAFQDQVLVDQMTKKNDQQFLAKKVEIKEEEVVRGPAAVVEEEEVLPTPPVHTAPVSAVTHKDSAKNKEVLNSLSSSLFANNDEAVAPPASPSADVAAADTTADSEPAVEEFRMPSRIGTGKVKSPKGGASSTNTLNAASTPSRAAKEEEVVEPIMRREDSSYMAAYMASSLAASAAAVPVKGVKKSGSKEALSAAAAGGSSSPSKGETPIAENEDEEEEGTGDLANLSNILTREERRAMSSQQKANWRAKQADLTTRRKDFHGVVTYTFDGIFSWQMYGSAEASDENGNPYTEYLMRCQWGTTFENLQPWIVAHRYKEFDTLDQKLKKSFPSFEKNMPSLPKKDLFRYLDTNVIAQRRTILEDYMSKIVVSMPTILRSEIMNEFLNISERIASIRLKLTLINTTNVNISGSNASKKNNARIAAEETVSPEVIPYGTTNELHRPVEIRDPLSAGSSNTASKTSSSTGHSNSMFGDEDPFGLGAVTKTTSTKKLFQKAPAVQNDEEEEERLVLYLTLDSAEAAKEAQNSPSLDDNALGQLEEDIKGLYIMLRKTPVEQLLPKKSKFRNHLLSVCHRWPRLRATCVVGMGVDFSLIPRAMQAEEDLQRYIGEFRSIEAATGV